MTELSGAVNNSNFDSKTILQECEDSKYVYTSVLDIFDLRTSEKYIEYISFMGNNNSLCFRCGIKVHLFHIDTLQFY